MLIFILTMLLMLAFLDKTLRLDRQKSRALETEFELSAIRDSVMLRVVAGEQPNNEALRFFNELIDNTKKCLDAPLLWELAVAIAFFSDKITPDSEQKQFDILKDHRDNRVVSEGYQQYQATVGRYLLVRHRLLIRFLRLFKTGNSRTERARQTLPTSLNATANIPFYSLVYS